MFFFFFFSRARGIWVCLCAYQLIPSLIKLKAGHPLQDSGIYKKLLSFSLSFTLTTKNEQQSIVRGASSSTNRTGLEVNCAFYCGWTVPLVQTPREVLFLSFNP